MLAHKTLALMIGLVLAIGVASVLGWLLMIRMPGKSHGAARPLTKGESALRAELIADVQKLGGEIGERNLTRFPELQRAAQYIEGELTGAGWSVAGMSMRCRERAVAIWRAELRGASSEIVIIGAHYDSVVGSPGANDNGSGVAALLALARRLARSHNSRTIRLLAFVNEEPDYFQSSQMGSYVYAGSLPVSAAIEGPGHD